jgi:16S rRNA (uracil1498-N3)-methyltransferase
MFNMKLHRFIGKYDLSQTEAEITDAKTIKQIRSVLRMEKGEKIILSDGKGKEAEVTLDFLSAEKIVGTINTHALDKSSGVVKQVNLYLAILKKENFELAVQKAVECGVSEITPIITERTVKTGLNIARLEKIILEASEQCEQNIVPTLSSISNFEDALKNANGEKIIFHLGGDEFKPDKNSKQTSIFVGPEGGFTEKEISMAKDAGFVVASLGPLTLRGETAAIIGTYRATYSI